MSFKILLLVTVVLTFAFANPQSVASYLSVPENAPAVDVSKPIVKQYEEDASLDIPRESLFADVPKIPSKPIQTDHVTKTPSRKLIAVNVRRRNDPKIIQVYKSKFTPSRPRSRQLPQNQNLYLTSEATTLLENNGKRIRSAHNPNSIKFKRPHVTTTTEPEILEDVVHDVPTSPEEFELIHEEEELQEEAEELLSTAAQKAMKLVDEEFQKQAKSAKYSFASNVNDGITGNQHHREETRDGLNVKGSYSYSDGFFKYTVHYEADDKGYRVVHQEKVPLGDGPKYNPKGEVNVETNVGGKMVNYRLTEEDYGQRKQTTTEEIPLASNSDQRHLSNSSKTEHQELYK